MKTLYLRSDSRQRISLGKVVQQMREAEQTNLYRVTVINGKIILEPIREEPSPDAWLFAPENKEILKHVSESLKQEATINKGSFKKHIK